MAESPSSQGPGVPSVQGVYDALRGGHRNRAADKAAAAALELAFAGIGEQTIDERDFSCEAVAWAAAGGIRQFISAPVGIPRGQGWNIHEAARAVNPGSVTAYVCGDRYAAAWSRALLAEGDPLEGVIEASVRSPGRVYSAVKGLIDLTQPVCVVVPMALHLVPPRFARLMLSGVAAPLAAGSAVAVSAWAGGDPGVRHIRRVF